MKILVTGATGFIGKHLVKRCLSEGYEVIISLLKNEASPFPHDVKTHVFKEINIGVDIKYLKDQKVNGVIHLASLYLTNHTPEDILMLIDSNVQFGSYILECSTQAKIAWFINTGTFWQNYQNKDYSPVNLYAATKQAFESIAQFYVEKNQIRFCTLRLSDTYGPNDTRSKVFNIWNNVAKTGDELNMSLGEQTMDIVYIDDIIDAFILLLEQIIIDESKFINGTVYVVTANNRYTLKELAKIFEETTNKKLNISWGSRPYREREVMVPWKNGKVVPGWHQKITIEMGIKMLFDGIE